MALSGRRRQVAVVFPNEEAPERAKAWMSVKLSVKRMRLPPSGVLAMSKPEIERASSAASASMSLRRVGALMRPDVERVDLLSDSMKATICGMRE